MRVNDHRLRLVSSIIVLSQVFIVTAILVTCVVMLNDNRLRVWSDSERSAEISALKLELDVGGALETSSNLVSSIATSLSVRGIQSLSIKSQEATLFNTMKQPQDLTGVYVYNRVGRATLFSPWGTTAEFVPYDHADFLAHLQNTDLGVLFGRPVESGSDHQLYIGVSRRINDEKGSFLGVVFGALRLNRVISLFDALTLDEQVDASLLRPDGMVIAWRSKAAPVIRDRLLSSGNLARVISTRTGVVNGEAVSDGTLRTYVYRRIGELPFVLMVGYAGGAARRSWTVSAVCLACISCLAILVVSFVTFWCRRELSKRDKDDILGRQNSGQLQLILNNTSELLLRVDWDGTQRFVSAASVRILGRASFELLGKSCYEYVDENDAEALRKSIVEARSTLVLAPTRCRVLHMNGSWRVIDIQGRALDTASGLILMARDITEKLGLEQRLQQSHRIEAVGRLTSGVAHDFNNVLQTLLGNLELALDDVADMHDTREYLLRAVKAGQRGGRLTSHLLSFSRQQALQPEIINLSPFLHELEQTLARTLGHRIEICLSVPIALVEVFVDPAHFDAALLNLALNARDAMPNGGILKFDVRTVDDDVVLTVSDNGEGMAEEVAARACEPFYSTKGLKGSGLGLSMAFGFIAQSGGELTIDSQPGQGTRINLKMPLVRRTHHPTSSRNPTKLLRIAK